jgi:hypothetical protein
MIQTDNFLFHNLANCFATKSLCADTI